MFLDRTSKSFIAIFASVATFLLILNHTVNETPLRDWWLAGLLLAVAAGFWVWLWQERDPEETALMVADVEAPVHVREFTFEGKMTAYDGALAASAAVAALDDEDDDDPQMQAAMEAAADAAVAALDDKDDDDPQMQAAMEAAADAAVATVELQALEEVPAPQMPEAPTEAPASITEDAAPEVSVVEPAAEVAPVIEEKTGPEAKEAPIAEAAKVEPAAGEQESDDLERVEGIGPKYREALNAAGVFTFEQLAQLSLERIEEIAKEAGMRRAASMETWMEQAQLAADGKWDELNALQDQLKGGRRE